MENNFSESEKVKFLKIFFVKLFRDLNVNCRKFYTFFNRLYFYTYIRPIYRTTCSQMYPNVSLGNQSSYLKNKMTKINK